MKFTIAELKQIIKEEMKQVLEFDAAAAAEVDGNIDDGQETAQDIASDAVSDIERAAEASGLSVDQLIQMVVTHLAGQK
tara:strand:- start:163 stop:399 length:237 start_codon:yes stop_codon:yes gene_type:complete